MNMFRQALIEYMQRQPNAPKELDQFIDADEDLLESGVLDSFAFLELTLHLEQALGVTIDYSQTPPDELTKPSQLAAYFEANS